MEELNNEEMLGAEGGGSRGNQFIKGIRFKEKMGKIIAFDVGYCVDISSIEVYEYRMTDGSKGRCNGTWHGKVCTVYDIGGDVFCLIGYRAPRIIVTSTKIKRI